MSFGSFVRVGFGLTCLVLSACAPLGPQVIQITRPQYNIAVQQTDAQQLLLNIVRQRYDEPILFLEVTGITNTMTRSVNATFLDKIINAGGRDEITPSVGASLAETPVISYVPNTGEKFVRQMLTPLDLRTIALVLQSNWSMERLLLLSGESINFIRNTPSARGENRFHDIAVSFRHLQRTGLMTVGVETASKDAVPFVSLKFSPEAVDTDAYKKMCGYLGVKCDGSPVRLVQAVGGSSDKSTATLATRSLFSSIYFLSQAVEVPPDHVAAGVVKDGANQADGPFADRDGHAPLFRIRATASEPANALVKVHYRNTWFYIADNDRDSKTTFALLSMLIMLQTADVAKSAPLISLPIN